MKHLEDEDIARMIEGKISKSDRETFLQHLSECSTCFNVYTETLKFVEEEKKSKFILTFPSLEKLKTAVQRFRQKFFLVPALSSLIIILLILSFLLVRLPDNEIIKAKTSHLAKRYADLEKREIYTFAQQGDNVYAAVRTGIFKEDLSHLINTAGKEELRAKIVKMLNRELKVAANEEKLSELIRFGRFIEHNILETFEGKRPDKDEIEKYLRIAKEYHLPVGVIKNLQKARSGKNIKQVLEEITEVFFASQ